MNNTLGGTCLTNNMKITVKVLDPSQQQQQQQQQEGPITKSSLAAISHLSSLTISSSESVHTNKNLINTNLIYKFYTSTIKPLKMRLNSITKKYKTVFKHATSSTPVETKSSRLTSVIQQDNDLIIIQPDLEYAELLSLLQKQQKQASTSSIFNQYFHSSSTSISKSKSFYLFLILLMILNFIKS